MKEKVVKRNNLKVILFSILLITLIFVIVIGVNFYNRIYSVNLSIRNESEAYLNIPTGSTFTDVLNLLEEKKMLLDVSSFKWVAERMSYTNKVKSGRFKLTPGMNNKELISLLRSGRQSPVKVTFNNIRNIHELCGFVGTRLEADSASLSDLLTNPGFLLKNNLDAYNVMSIFIPNTYHMNWNTSAEQFFERMLKEYNLFWSGDRVAKAKEIGFTPLEISVIASIVEKESNKVDERPVIAGVYINRYKKGWKLEADPTLVFALGDFTIRRVLNEHKQIDSPYNTYMHEGLPPGPICMPSQVSIDAVLNYSRHEYMFFCAKDDFSGYHAFAKNYSTHLLNAKRFQKELSRRNIHS